MMIVGLVIFSLFSGKGSLIFHIKKLFGIICYKIVDFEFVKLGGGLLGSVWRCAWAGATLQRVPKNDGGVINFLLTPP